jgi:hypothetical protein
MGEGGHREDARMVERHPPSLDWATDRNGLQAAPGDERGLARPWPAHLLRDALVSQPGPPVLREPSLPHHQLQQQQQAIPPRRRPN